MVAIRAYTPAMQSAAEACFRACVEALGWAYQPGGRHADIADIESAYMRRGCFWCLFDDQELIGMVAVRCIDDAEKIAEMKRLYLLPEYQGNGYGETLFKCALDYAKERGYKALRADTRQDRAAALHLMDKHRFRRIEQYNRNEFAELYFELELTKYESKE